MSEHPGDILPIDEVAYLKASKRTIYRLELSGTFRAFTLAEKLRFGRAELDQWIASQIGKAPNSATDGVN